MMGYDFLKSGMINLSRGSATGYREIRASEFRKAVALFRNLFLREICKTEISTDLLLKHHVSCAILLWVNVFLRVAMG